MMNLLKGLQPNFSVEDYRRTGLLRNCICVSVILLAMCSDVHHDFLWGPDEPRDAEISREVLLENHWIVPRLCNLPFLEKPPLYYDLTALVFKATGIIAPWSARLVPCLLGLSMLAAVFLVGRKWGGFRRGIICLLLLAGMPQFFIYSHWILVDIGVGAFCSVALSLFAWWFFWPSREKITQQALLCLFYLVCAFAFLTKGLIACFHIFVTIGFFFMVCLFYKKRECQIQGFFSPIAMLFFVIPVSLWLFLFWKEGGVCYLHEHFVNNLLGRFLHRHFELKGCHFYHTDIGNSSPWYRYLKRLPDMVGITYVFLPLAAWDIFKGFKSRKPQEELGLPPLFKIFLAIWTFLPGVILSFAAQKEVSYLLPSYAGAALLTGGWLDSKLPHSKNVIPRGLYWISLVVPVSLATFWLVKLDTRIFLYVTGGFLIIFLPLLLYFFLKKQYCHMVFLALAIQVGAVVIGNTPKVIYDTRLHAKTYGEMAKKIKEIAGQTVVCVFKPDDYMRGSVSFYNNVFTPELEFKTYWKG